MSRCLSIVAINAGWILGAVAGSVASADTVYPRSERVPFYRVELGNRAGVEQTYRRLQRAAARVCGDEDSKQLVERMQFQRCVEESLARAVAEVHDASLTAYHQHRSAAAAAIAAVSAPRASLP